MHLIASPGWWCVADHAQDMRVYSSVSVMRCRPGEATRLGDQASSSTALRRPYDGPHQGGLRAWSNELA